MCHLSRLYYIFTYYLFFFILFFSFFNAVCLQCKTIFYATCHLSGEFFLLMWTLYGASKGPFY
ncbi:unnamed protein product [Brassica rapa]|uniref:Uncharacterized protein n=1 Tax=Brassica campestris TaxID=3711 RepID=A0A8D9LVS5_BRACM|nr:unnamed protein product [Brassica rapa]